MKDKTCVICLLLFITGLLSNLELTMALMIAQQQNEDEVRPSSSVSYLACDCPHGFYAKGTMTIFIATNICLQSQFSAEEQQITFKKTTTFPSMIPITDLNQEKQQHEGNSQTKLIPVTMKMCQSCALGCSLCLGPDDNDCLQCLPGYLRNYDQIASDVTSDEDLPQSESTTTTLSRQKRTSGPRKTTMPTNTKSTPNKDIYEEEGLLATNQSPPIKNRKRGDFKMKKYTKTFRTSEKVTEISNEDSQFDVDDNFMTFEAEGSSGYIEKEDVSSFEPPPPPPKTTGDDEQGRVTGHMLAPVKRHKNYHKIKTDNIDFDVVDYYGDLEADSSNNFSKFSKEEEERTPKLKIESMVGSGEDVSTKATTATVAYQSSTMATISDETQPTALATTTATAAGMDTTELTNTSTNLSNAIQWKESSPFSCVVKCPFGFYALDNRICQACHLECIGCLDNGTNNCLECRHFEQDGHCVPFCQFNNTEWLHLWNVSSSNCSIGGLPVRQGGQEILVEIPASYYAVPPLVILGGLFFMLLSYFRRRYRLQLNWPCTRNGRACRNNNQDHEEHKKCFLNRQKQINQMATLKLPNEQTNKRPGNAYVFTEKHLPSQKRFTFHSGASVGHHHSTWPHSHKETEDDFYELDPLYETPDREGIRRMYPPYHRRRSSASTQCYLIPSNMQQNRGIPQITVGDHQMTKQAASVHNTPEMPARKKRLNSEAEVPKFEAPPLPLRNSSLDNDDDNHIYVNIDEER